MSVNECIVQRRRQWTRDELLFVRKNAGKMSCTEIANHLGRTPSSIRSKASRWSASLVVSSVDDHDAWLCCELYREGLTIPVIAKKMELAQKVVANIVYGGK